MKITYHTMDTISYQSMQSYCAGNNAYGGFNTYVGTDLNIPTPTSCPCCNKVLATNLLPIIAFNNLNKINNEKIDEECLVLSVYRCSDCNQLFAIWSKGFYSEKDSTENEIDGEQIAIYPFDNTGVSYSKDINNLSPNFVEIYHQAEQAEHMGLNDICGMGYRKALEFLVDDYVRYKNPGAIIDGSLALSKKIDNYISDNRIKELAKKATWIGNDATHIIKKHPDRDINDIKKFIKAIVTMIDCDYACEDAKTI